MFFVYVYGGTGKTYLYKTLKVVVRSKQEGVKGKATKAIVLDPRIFQGSRFVQGSRFFQGS